MSTFIDMGHSVHSINDLLRPLVLNASIIRFRKKELIFLNVSFNNIEHLPPELGDLLLLR